jgi:hypothetical protein
MPFSGFPRTRFKMHNEFGDHMVYFINGLNTHTNLLSNICTRFDMQSRKWKQMPSLTNNCPQPGTFISRDKNFLYAFGDYMHQKNFCERLNIGKLSADKDKQAWVKI